MTYCSVFRQVLLLTGFAVSAFTLTAPLSAKAPAQMSGCTPSWVPTFGGEPGVNRSIIAMATLDDGSGQALYVGGDFSVAGGQLANHVAKWEGTTWSSLGSGLDGDVRALALFDDGAGPALYAGGSFTTADGVPVNRIAKWNGSSWSPVGRGLDVGVDSYVDCLEVFDDGGGAALYVGGGFTSAGGTPASHIAKWDGTDWSPVLAGVNGEVRDLAVFDDGTGTALFVGGTFSVANGLIPGFQGGLAAKGMAKWNGSTWSALGSGLEGFGALSLSVLDDGSGSALYAGGSFSSAGGSPASNIAKWNGSAWSALGSGVNATVRGLQAFDAGGGTSLFATGGFSEAGGVATQRVARWDGMNWSAVGGANIPNDSLMHSLAAFDDGRGLALYVGGGFNVDSLPGARGIARFDGTVWEAVGNGLKAKVRASTVFNDGSGPALYVGGDFIHAGGEIVNHVAKWNGSSWSPLGINPLARGTSGPVHSLTTYDDGTGLALYAGGEFVSAGGVSALRIAKWDGTNWTSLSSGMNAGATVRALAVFDDGGGEALYAAGDFFAAGGTYASNVAKWDGTNWSPLLGGVSGMALRACSLCVFDDGGGEDLYIGGRISATVSSSGVETPGVARWDGTTWSALAGGTGLVSTVRALAVYDDGTGDALYMGGDFLFSTADHNFVKWNGTAFESTNSDGANRVFSLGVFDDGSGTALFVGGAFVNIGGIVANRIARFDGTSYQPLESGMEISVSSSSSAVETLAVFDDGGGEALYAGGLFSAAGDSGDSQLAKWGCAERSHFDNFCNGDGGDQAGCTDCPCNNNAPPGSIGGCLNSHSRSARLQGSGVPSLASDTMRFELTGGAVSTFAILFSGAARAPANAINPCFGLDTGIQSPTFDGLRCAVQSVLRHGTRATDLNGGVGVTTNGWGAPSGPVGGLIAQGGFISGQTRHYQVVYREEVTLGCMRGLNSSQGVTVTFEP